jgi:SAM-dependent methyltransferase
MNPDDYKKATLDWYRERLAQHGAGIKALSSGTEERRAVRFGVLTGVGIEPGCSVLDVGCGFADYYAYLQQRDCKVAYTGVDIVPEFIAQARQTFPGLDLQVRDLQKDPVGAATYDFVVSSQTFNLRFGGESNLPLVTEMMKRMFAAARKGVAIDFVTDYVDFKEDYLVYHNPEAMFRLAKSLTKRVVLKHDYPLYEFCLYLYPDFQAWGRPA